MEHTWCVQELYFQIMEWWFEENILIPHKKPEIRDVDFLSRDFMRSFFMLNLGSFCLRGKAQTQPMIQ